MPCCMTWEQIIQGVVTALDLPPGLDTAQRLAKELADVPPSALQLFTCHMHLAGCEDLELGPDWLSQKRRAACFAALGRKRAVADS